MNETAPADAFDLPHVLVVDDDERLLRLLSRYLAENGFIVATASDAADGRARMRSLAFDLIVLDVMMPGESGLSLTADLAGDEAAPPVLLLTAMGDSDHRVAGLESGAEDYLSKPFEPRELVLRMRTILRRRMARPAQAVSADEGVRFGPFAFDPARMELTRDGAPVRLTSAEAALLATLAGEPGRVFARDELGGAAGGGDRAVDVQMTRLRRKIEPDPRFPRYLLTMRGQGYALRAD